MIRRAMRLILSLSKGLAALACIASLSQGAHARDWQAKVNITHYPVDGGTGFELYQSIGQNGPVVSLKRAIALTEYELLWGRDYTPEGTACRITRAQPFLTITYTLPRPRGQLSGAIAAKWAAFSEGIWVHEQVHGAYIRGMVDDIIDETAGLVMESDPDCRKLRAEVERRVILAHERYKDTNRRFEASEMAPGGNVHQLILGLVQ